MMERQPKACPVPLTKSSGNIKTSLSATVPVVIVTNYHNYLSVLLVVTRVTNAVTDPTAQGRWRWR